ncbi:hypothetical protein phiAS5_ORF0316 [Aeromonas phage phiAS5]|uniref:Uncharacterized protein n=1 Tax=Aeromonas phage phiAS5 TaxID=879630 RepID=E1A270_9CAUD|nr:hypothetical protein phiAS5_ORF0316 [Aeromonas phage phiAS5]ADM80159.1 hypothetical protein phiAS5_ORF0316 [Aeromonas phage phiAS5]BES53080.1 hypothetical protein [Aeromonas phage phiWae14]
MNIENLFDFMDALRKQENPEDFIDSDGIGNALEEITEYDLGKPSHGSRHFYGRGYSLDMNWITVYFETGCSCCRDSDNHYVSYQKLWDHLVKTGKVSEIEE